MYGSVRLGVDKSTGHGCFAPVVPVTASIDVYVDQIAAVRLSDAYQVHCCPKKGCHAPIVKMGSRTVYANQLQECRSKDPMTCGDRALGCSISTYAGS